MSSAPDHLDPKEATEAKLCAYLEGELSPEDRQDIEAHLKVNPQHRQLLIDLAETRQWMRQIPHEPAPSDLADSVAAQMERSMLLDDARDTGDSPIVRLPQYAMLAAVLLLTLGLGVLIVAMLRGGQNNYSLATRTTPTDGAPTGGAPAALKQSTSVPAAGAPAPVVAPLADAVADKPAPAPVVTAPPATPAEVVTKSFAAPFAARRAVVVAPVVSPEDLVDHVDLAKVESIIRERKIAGNRPQVCLIVSSPDPSATGAQIRRFFGSNQVVFDDEQSELTPATDRLAANTAPGSNTANSAGGFKDKNGKDEPQNDQIVTQQNNAAADFVSKNNNGQQSLEAAPTTQPAAEMVYVGRSMTPLQVELLHGTLATGGIDQTIRRINLTSPTAVKSIAAVADPSKISRGQTLTITVPQLVGPGIEKTNVVKVADDGTINLPMMLDPLPAEGATAAELQYRIAAKYREGNFIPTATVSVIVNSSTTQPTSMPAAVRPTTVPAASQPAAPATQPIADDKVDVLVLVRKSP